jgi:drug/metabolite transporter (DMT)-like permease
MAIVLGLAAALTYGAADFLGAFATKTTKVFTVVLVSQVLGSGLLILVLPFFLESPAPPAALIWGALAGVAGAVGVALFYQGLSVGRMGAVAPITGVEAAVVPVIFGLLSGERPSVLAFAGVVVALGAVALVSSSPKTEDAPAPGSGSGSWWLQPGIALAIGAGIAFGAFFILLDQAGDNSGLWPLVGARVSSIITIAVGMLAGGGFERPQRAAVPAIAGAGVLDVAANLFFLLATRQGLLSIVAVLTSMYPATTVVLARFVLEERFHRTQLIGLALAALGVTAMTLG